MYPRLYTAAPALGSLRGYDGYDRSRVTVGQYVTGTVLFGMLVYWLAK